MADNLTGTQGHEEEVVNVGGLKATMQKFKTEKLDAGLSGKQDVVNDLTDIRSGASKGATAYQKPSGGIPKSDLASEVKTSLGKADTAIQDVSGKVDKTTTVNGHALSGNVTVSKSDVGLGNVTNDAQVKRSEMGTASGVATLDSAGKVPSSQLPSYVDDVLEYDSRSGFPATGEGGKIYVDKSNNTTWRWSGSAYSQIKGDLVIGTTSGTAADGGTANSHYNNTSNPHNVTKAQVGLGNVANTGDSATPVSGGTTKFTTGGAYTELNKKVDKVSGKGLSTNDYTTDEKNKLAGIAAGAEVNVQSDWNATSGDAFIKNKPTIPSEVTESTVSGWGFTKNAGTITGIKMNGSSKGTSGVVDLGTVITAHQDISGKVDKTTTVNGHALSGNVSVTKSDVGLGNVGNFKAVSTVASQGLSNTEKANARANIGAGTSSFSGSYNDLSNKPTIPAAAANGTYTVKTLVGSTTTNVSDFTANQSSADDVTFVQGSNVTITPDATNRKITIAAKDTTYSSKAAASGGTDVSLVTTGEKYTWNNKQNAIVSLKEIGFGFTTCSTSGGTAAKVANLSGFVLKEFAHVSVLFTNGFTTTGSTLNVNGTGAKPIYFCGSAIIPQKIANNTVVQMVYDGTNWNVTSIEYFGSAPVSGAVDLGLPSGVLWAECNVGASVPEGEGSFFSWGNVVGHSSSSGYNFSQATYNGTTGAALDGNISAGDTYDAARHNLGGGWRIPTQTEYQELLDNCNSVWTKRNSVDGRLLTSRTNGNTVFFPAAGRCSDTNHDSDGNGYYWSSTWVRSTHAFRFDFNSSQIRASNNGARFYGFSIRAVM